MSISWARLSAGVSSDVNRSNPPQRVREAEKLLISEARSLTEVRRCAGLMTSAISGRFFANTPLNASSVEAALQQGTYQFVVRGDEAPA